MYLEPMVEPHFHKDSYGYRPGKSAIRGSGGHAEALLEYQWVLEFDIKALFDNIDFELLMKTVRWHTELQVAPPLRREVAESPISEG